MPWVDLGIVIVLAGFAVNGLMRGMIRQLTSLAGFLVGLILALVLHRGLALQLASVARFDIALEPLVFVVIFLSVWILASLMGFAAQRRSRDEEDNWVDDVGGSLLGLVTGLVMLSILAAGLVRLGLPLARQVRASPIGAWLLAGASLVGHCLSRWVSVPWLL